MANLATITTNILADSGIDDINVVVSTGSYSNPAWIISLAWTKITGAPANIVTGTGSVGQVAFFNGTSSITGESNLFWDATNDRLGIGNANPGYSLDVIASSATDSNIFRAGMSGTSNGFTVQRVSSNFRYTFLDGNVGIGTNGPVSILDITGSAPILTLNRNGGAFTNTINFNQSGTNYASIISNAGSGEQRYSIGPSVAWGGFHTFYTDTVERLRITSIGNVGIGTITPTNYTGYRTLAVNNTSGSVLELKVNDVSALNIFSDSAQSYFYEFRNLPIWFATNATERMRITAGGNVLIGTTTPNGNTLRVGGTGWFDSGVFATEGVFNNGTGSGNGIKVISSLSSSLFTGGIEFLRTTVAGGSKVQPLRDAAIGGVGFDFLVTANNTAEINATYTSALKILNTGAATFSNLSGSGTRMVVADANGLLSTQAIGSGAITGSGTTNYLPKFTGASTIGNSVIQEASGFIGIGVSPSSNIDILGSSSRLRLDGTSSSFQILSRNTANSSTNPIIFDADTYTYNRGGVFRMQLDSSGNLGLGVTPSAWDGTLVKAIQLADHGASISSFTTGNTSSKFAFVTNNAFYDNSGWKYATNGSVAQYRLANDNHQWYVAPSGTAGNAISFTQAMTLGSNSGLSIGTPSAAPAQGLLVQGQSLFNDFLTANNGVRSSSLNGFVLRNDANSVNLGGLTRRSFWAGGTALDTQIFAETGYSIFLNPGGSTSIGLTLASTGAATFSNTVRVNGGELTVYSGSSVMYTGVDTGNNYVYFGTNTANYGISFQASGDRMRIFNDGNVSINNTSNAGFKLDVVGSFRTGANGMALDSNGFAVTPNASRPWNAFRYSHPQNIVPNGDLESWTSGTSTAPDGFGGYDLGGSTIITRESSIIKEGLYSAKISNPTGTAFSGMVYDGVRVDKTPSSSASSSYTISFWYLTPATNGSVSYIGVFDTASSSYSFIEQLPRAGVWVFYSRTFSIRDDSNWNVTWWVSWGGGTANDTLYVDSVALNKGNQIYNTTRSAVSTTGDVTRWGGFNNLGGNVGIGTASPGSPLSVAGVGGSTRGSNGYLVHVGGTDGNIDPVRYMIGFSHGNTFTADNVRAAIGMMVSSGGSGNLVFETGAGGAGQTERMRITSGGNVGIGGSPTFKLDVQNNTQAITRILDTSTNSSLILQAGTGSAMKITGYNYNTSTAIPLYISVDGANTIMQNGGGNVGIGTTSPSAMLTLLGLTPYIRIERSGVNTWQIQNNNNVGTITGFSINNVTAGTTPFFINQDTGNLLLGATADNGFRLDVNGTGRFSGELFTSLSNGAIRLRDNGTAQVEVNIRHSSTRNGVLSFTQEAVADRWAIGTKPSDGTLYFSANFDLSTPRLTLTSAGAATFSSSVTAGQGRFYSGSSSIDGLIVNGAGGIGSTRQGTIKFGDAGNIYRIEGGQDYEAMNFITNGLPRLVIKDNGNVGIGTASPYQAKLDVNGVGGTGSVANIAASNSSLDQLLIGSINRGSAPSFLSLPTGSAFLQAVGNGVANTLGIGTFGAAPLIFGTSNTERMRINESGDILFKGQDTAATLGARFVNNSNELAFYSSNDTSGPSKAISFYNRFGASELRLRIASNGNVLIGTTDNPGDLLRVNQNTFTNTITTYRPGVNTTKSDAWKLGRAALGTQPTETHQITVEIGGVSYVIGAAQL